MTIRRGAYRIEATTIPELLVKINRFLELLQQGGLVLSGAKLDVQRTAAPSDAPSAGQPNLVAAVVGGVNKIYWWNGAAWVAVV